MALRSQYSDMYFSHALPRIKKSKTSKMKMSKVRKPKMKMKSMFGKRRGKKKPIY